MDILEKKRLSGFAYLLILALAICGGAAVTALLTWAKVSHLTLPCGADFQCEEVLASKYASLFGIPISVFGLLAYLTLFGLELFAIKTSSPRFEKYGFWLASAGLFGSVLLFLISHFALGAHCKWCMTSGVCFAVCTFALAMRQTPGAWFPKGTELIYSGMMLLALGGALLYGRGLVQSADEPACDILAARRLSPEAVIGDGPIRWGNPNAPFTVVMFADFQCPACHDYFGPVQSLTLRHGGQFVLRNFPHGFHVHAFDTASAIYSEGAQGAKDAYKFLTSPINDRTAVNFIDSVQGSCSKIAWHQAQLRVKSDLVFAAGIGTKFTPCFLYIQNGYVRAEGSTEVIDAISQN